MNLNDTDIVLINRDIALLLVFLSLVATVFKVYKAFKPQSFSQGWAKKLYVNLIEDTYYALIIIAFLRSFLFEAYVIPSGSMQPSLYPGDFVVVNKYAYGVKVPGLNSTIWHGQSPKAGEIAVFLDPQDPTVRKMIKRIVATPGDQVSLKNGVLKINGEIKEEVLSYRGFDYANVMGEKVKFEAEFKEQSLGDTSFLLQRIPILQRNITLDFIVPNGHYFVMGDNRENSTDSRFWGFVPEKLLCGRASAVLLSIGKTDGTYTQKRVGLLH